MENDLPRYMTFKQAMQYLNIKSYNTLYKLIDNGLPIIFIDGIKRVDQQAVDTYLASQVI